MKPNGKDGRCYLTSQSKKDLNTSASTRFKTFQRSNYCPVKGQQVKTEGHHTSSDLDPEGRDLSIAETNRKMAYFDDYPSRNFRQTIFDSGKFERWYL